MNHINYHYFLTTIGSRARHVIGLIESLASQKTGNIAIVVKNSLFTKEVESLLTLHAIPCVTALSEETSTQDYTNKAPIVYIISEDRFSEIKDKNISGIISLFSSYSLESIMKKQALCTKDASVPCRIIEIILQFDIEPIQKLYSSHSISMTQFTLAEEKKRVAERFSFVKDFLQAIQAESLLKKEVVQATEDCDEEQATEGTDIEETLTLSSEDSDNEVVRYICTKIAHITLPSLEFSSHTNMKRDSSQTSYKKEFSSDNDRRSSYGGQRSGERRSFSRGGYNKDGGGSYSGNSSNRSRFRDSKGGYEKREGGYEKREGGYEKREGGGGYPRRDGGYQKREGGYQRREGGYQKREGGYQGREGGYQKREYSGDNVKRDENSFSLKEYPEKSYQRSFHSRDNNGDRDRGRRKPPYANKGYHEDRRKPFERKEYDEKKKESYTSGEETDHTKE